MWALRRAAAPIRSHSSHVRIAQAFCAKSEFYGDSLEQGLGSHVYAHFRAVQSISSMGFSHIPTFRYKCSVGRQTLSSQAGAKSSDEEDADDGFSELETASETEDVVEKNISEEKPEEQISESEFSDDESEADTLETTQSGLVLSDAEVDHPADKDTRKKVSSLFKVIVAAPRQGVPKAIDQWVAEGNSLGRSEIFATILNLRKRKMFLKALQLLEWLEANKQLEHTERDYASHLDLIAKVHGISRAEKYIERIPKSFRGEVIYRTLLANCSATTNLTKTEEVFNKMKDLGFPLTTFSCNQLLILYKKLDKKKIADVLLMMEKESVKPSLFTYKLLIDTKGRANDMDGMEQVVETMKAEGMEPDLYIQSMIAKYYMYGGFREKAEKILKEMEGDNLKENRGACIHLLYLYATLGSANDVERVWKVCEASAHLGEFLAAVEAWGKLEKVDKAEAVFEKMQKSFKLSTKHYTALLRVYASNNLMIKGKELVKKMSDIGIQIGPYTWDALVKLYVEAGEVEKADSFLQKASEQNSNAKPHYSSYMALLSQYAKRGDIHNAEKIFNRLRLAGYVGRMQQYQTLLQAYVNSKAPAYGFRERMKADNIHPNKTVAGMLIQVDGFKKGSVLSLLE
ncbi:pentatricopeptide repeat-containing protein At1g80270, mitochondrial-like [Aristolochia californica]|uniref:pentatricopeptide repeat-containing protein At1g80270, mitochondrial-like n=1 Tax=Aristolochia californica TaxID=171875 RepID=UPI0035DC537A